MRVFTSYNFNGAEIAIKAPETHGDFNYLCNLAVAQKMFVNQDYVFGKLLNRERYYIRHITAIMHNDEMYGISLIWDYIQRAADLKRVESVEKMHEYGFLQHAIGVYVPDIYRRGKIGSLLVNYNMKSFDEDVCCIGEVYEQQKFWMSPRVDKTFLKFMLIDQASTKITF
jgi:hypothetical protein